MLFDAKQERGCLSLSGMMKADIRLSGGQSQNHDHSGYINIDAGAGGGRY